MKTVLLWMLLSTDYYGRVTTVAYFADAKQCEHVRKNLPWARSASSICVQANVIVLPARGVQ